MGGYLQTFYSTGGLRTCPRHPRLLKLHAMMRLRYHVSESRVSHETGRVYDITKSNADAKSRAAPQSHSSAPSFFGSSSFLGEPYNYHQPKQVPPSNPSPHL